MDWKPVVKLDDRYLRPSEVDLLIGDPTRAKNELGWTPKTTFRDLVRLMVDADLASAEREKRDGKAGPPP